MCLEKIQANKSNENEALYEPLHPKWQKRSRSLIIRDPANSRAEKKRARLGADEISRSHIIKVGAEWMIDYNIMS